ncbi:heteromeric transposase endonuclease subunit TnsA [Undibacterium sp. LFS511W]|uniref:Heteromeric transposase endonuclease subunit TnsA n=1 Tax=Undibacterium luofuense TaxID=2828733 RepID=A0A941DGR9_9BURK|nr:heteromeric transposase endonuclease subunit TnsA [Undibacterium luofuense]
MPRQTRKIKPTRRSVSGVYPFRCETSIPFESTLERDFLIRAEFFVDVLDIIPQPIRVPFTCLNGESYVYTPDFLVYYKLGSRDYCNYPKPLLVEVKPEADWRKHWREWLPKWKAARQYALTQGWNFHIVDESRIRDKVFHNVRFLERYKRMTFVREESEAVISSVRDMGSTPVHYLLARHFMGIYREEGIAHIWSLIATRRLDCDVSHPLNEFTQVWIPHA